MSCLAYIEAPKNNLEEDVFAGQLNLTSLSSPFPLPFPSLRQRL